MERSFVYNRSMIEAPVSLHSYLNPIVHVDCDAFFTSVEQALDPRLKGRPVVTGKERGIVACASYEAKARGVKRPMRLFEAKRICPELVCLPSDYETYSLYSKRLTGIMRRFTPAVEEYSIDEAFAELSGLRRVHRMDYADIAWAMKETAQRELGLTVSVGLSASKTLAKLASQWQKPDGFMVLKANELHLKLNEVPVAKVWGIGPNTAALLDKHGVATAGDFIRRPQAWAKKLLGKVGDELWRELRGDAVHAVLAEEKDDRASVSKCKTFTPPTSDRDFVHAQALRNAESAFIKLRRHRLRAAGILLHLREHDFKSSAVEATLERPTSSTLEIGPIVTWLFDRLFDPSKKYRQSGVVLFKLAPEGETQYSLFDDVPKIRSLQAIDRVIDDAAGRFGKHALHLAAGAGLAPDVQHRTERGDVPERRRELLTGETARRHVGFPVWKVRV
jgi:DNA polymerase-4/DNA polymerase V